MLGAATQVSRTEDESVIVFHKYGDKYFMKNVKLSGANEAFTLLEGDLERNAAKVSPDKQVAMVIIR